MDELRLHGWATNNELIKANLLEFADMYGDRASFVAGPGMSFEPAVEHSLAKGERVDVSYCHHSYLSRWVDNGRLTPLDADSDVRTQIEAMTPTARGMFTDSRGRLLGLPHQYAFYSFAYRRDHLDQLGLRAPVTWDELIAQAKQIKRAGICRYPYRGWFVDAYGWFNVQFFTDCFSEGDYLFEPDGRPTFAAGDTGLTRVLKRYRLMYQEELMPPYCFADQGVPDALAFGHATFVTQDLSKHWLAAQAGFVFSTWDDIGFAIYPGTTHEVAAWGAAYVVPSNAADFGRAWRLARFLGGKAEDGRYHAPRRWLVEAGLNSPYPELFTDQQVRAELARRIDLTVWESQARLVRIREAARCPWFIDWELASPQHVQAYIRGEINLMEVLTRLTNLADTSRRGKPNCS